MGQIAGPNEYSSATGIPVDWLVKQAKAGRLPSLKIGRQFIFNVEAVTRAIAEMAAGSSGQQLAGREASHVG